MPMISPSVFRTALSRVVQGARAGRQEALRGVNQAIEFKANAPAGRVSVPQIPMDHVASAGHKASFSALVPEHHAAAGLAPGRTAPPPAGPASFAHGYLNALGLPQGSNTGRTPPGNHALGVATGMRPSATPLAQTANNAGPGVSAKAYVDRMGRDGVEGGLPELFAMSQAAGVQIDVFNLAADGKSLSRSTSIVPQAATQRISLLDDGKGIRAMLVNPRETQAAQPFSSARFLPQPMERDGSGIFGAVGLLTSISPKDMRAKACEYLAQHWDDKPEFLAGRSVGEAAAGPLAA
jgi:hypothetical protein